MKNIIIFGSPGAGKGTQSKLIAKKYKLTHLSSGDLLRKEVSSASELGKRIKTYQDQGILVPNELLTELMRNSIKNNTKQEGFIFDGYPRSIQQADILQSILNEENIELSLVINLEINKKEALKRILLRGEHSGRTDDNQRIIKKRFRVYREETEPILKYYREQEKLVNIDGEKTIEEIAKDIKEEINKL